MTKFCGNIGFSNTIELSPGVYDDSIIEKKYYGDFIRNNRQLQSSDQVNDNIKISNVLSIISDSFVINNLYSIKYVIIAGIKWKVSNIEIKYPRLIMTLGGIYNV